MVDRNHSRRGFLSAFAVASVVAAAPTIVDAQPIRPIEPAEYLTEMQAIGFRVVAGNFQGRALGVIERRPDGWDASERVRIGYKRIQLRVQRSGADFYERCAAYLFDRELREDVGPVAFASNSKLSPSAYPVGPGPSFVVT
jgi:hypothetical protein